MGLRWKKSLKMISLLTANNELLLTTLWANIDTNIINIINTKIQRINKNKHLEIDNRKKLYHMIKILIRRKD